MSQGSKEKKGDREAKLWSRLNAATDRLDYCGSWLELQVGKLPDIVQALIVAAPPGGKTYVPVCSWPVDRSEPERLAEVAERCLTEKCGLVLPLDEGTGPGYAIAYPFFAKNELAGVVCFEAACGAGALEKIMRRLQWGIAWLELYGQRERMAVESARQIRMDSALNLLAVVLAEAHLDSAAMALATELASVLDCDRVSIGFLRKSRIRVKAVSHTASFGKKMNLIRAISAAMEEAILMRREIVYPLPGDQTQPVLVRSHQELASLHASRVGVLTLPIYGKDRYLGAITLERPADKPFDDDSQELCRGVAALAFPVLEEKRLNERSPLARFVDGWELFIRTLLGPGYYGWKLAGAALLALVIFFSFAEGRYRLATDSVVEGVLRRVIAAPFNSYIAAAPAKAGDLVADGEILCTLDDRDLRQERLSWLSKINQYSQQHQEALAEHNRSGVKILAAQLDQAGAELARIEEKLARTVLQAPFGGLLVSGDLSMRLGGFVEQGEVLFELTPLSGYRVILKVDERRITDVESGQRGHVLLSALPKRPFPFVIEKITPITVPEEGRSFYRVEAALQEISADLRPGMAGVGKIDIDRRLLISIWTRDFIEWARLFAWSWWP
jgi:multidrug resistance efflux pump/spore maturation protein SpmB